MGHSVKDGLCARFPKQACDVVEDEAHDDPTATLSKLGPGDHASVASVSAACTKPAAGGDLKERRREARQVKAIVALIIKDHQISMFTGGTDDASWTLGTEPFPNRNMLEGGQEKLEMIAIVTFVAEEHGVTGRCVGTVADHTGLTLTSFVGSISLGFPASGRISASSVSSIRLSSPVDTKVGTDITVPVPVWDLREWGV